MKKEEKKKLLNHFERMCSERGARIKVKEISPIIDGFIDIIEYALNDNNRSIYDELKNIADNIRKLREDITSIDPEHIAEHHIPGATLELGEVVKSVEDATNIILDATEAIQNSVITMGDEPLKAQFLEQITRIFEACNFQDLTGQRITKVMVTLEFIEKAIQKILSLPIAKGAKGQRDKNQPDSLLNGPQRSGLAPSQDDIDKLFDSL